jgi:hypothetical protein
LNRSPKTTTPCEADAPTNARSFLSAWSYWLFPALLSFILAIIFRDPFIGDWDGLDYTVLSLHGSPSSMALGRGLFIYTNHALWLTAHAIFGLRAENAYLLFKYAVLAQNPLAVIACWRLAHTVTASHRVATVASLLIGLSPIFIIYSTQVMTDVPSVLLITLALIVHLRGVREKRLLLILAGAALLGASVNLRETVAFYAPWLILAPFVCGWKPRRRELFHIALSAIVFLSFALSPFIYWYLTDLNFRYSWWGWRESMRAESARHPVEWRNLFPFMLYFFAVAPVVLLALPVAAYREWRERGFSLLLALASVGLFANFLLIFNYSTIVNWRYFLTGLPALAPLVACYLMREQTRLWGSTQRAFVSIILCTLFIAVVFAVYMKPVSREHIERRSMTKDYRERLAHVPLDAVVMAGGQTIAVTYWRGIGSGRWDIIGTGGGWPGQQLEQEIENYLKQGRRVFLDRDPRWWSPCGWQSQETRALVKLEGRFRFRRVADHLYEIRPPDDTTANDDPNLESLLPENRPLDMKKCLGINKVT